MSGDSVAQASRRPLRTSEKSRVRVSVTPSGFRGVRNGVWIMGVSAGELNEELVT